MRLQKLTKAWFDFPNDPDGGKFEIKHLLAGEIAKIFEKTHKQGFDFREDANGELKPVPVFEIDNVMEKELTIVATIQNWENQFDENGEILKCNDKNKLRICREIGEEDWKTFLDFITDCRQKLSDIVKAQAEKEIKN